MRVLGHSLLDLWRGNNYPIGREFCSRVLRENSSDTLKEGNRISILHLQPLKQMLKEGDGAVDSINVHFTA